MQDSFLNFSLILESNTYASNNKKTYNAYLHKPLYHKWSRLKHKKVKMSVSKIMNHSEITEWTHLERYFFLGRNNLCTITIWAGFIPRTEPVSAQSALQNYGRMVGLDNKRWTVWAFPVYDCLPHHFGPAVSRHIVGMCAFGPAGRPCLVMRRPGSGLRWGSITCLKQATEWNMHVRSQRTKNRKGEGPDSHSTSRCPLSI